MCAWGESLTELSKLSLIHWDVNCIVNMNIIKLVSTLLFAVLLTACGAVHEFQVQSATSSYFEVAQEVNLGDSKDRVLNLLLPTQKNLSSALKKPPEKHMSDDVLVEIY